jgi:hypothetical protein
MNNDLTLTVLRRQLDQRKLVDTNIHNLAKSIFKPDLNIKYRLNARDYFGRVIEVIGVPGRTQVRVENVVTLKKRDIALSDVTGLVQEN